jgi:ribosomal protein L12E/L44/L45/RPP1/RPP2
VHLLSGVSGKGVDEVLRALVKEIRKRRPATARSQAKKAKPAKAVKTAKEKWAP